MNPDPGEFTPAMSWRCPEGHKLRPDRKHLDGPTVRQFCTNCGCVQLLTLKADPPPRPKPPLPAPKRKRKYGTLKRLDKTLRDKGMKLPSGRGRCWKTNKATKALCSRVKRIVGEGSVKCLTSGFGYDEDIESSIGAPAEI